MKALLLILAACASSTVLAGDIYISGARATPGEAYADFAGAKHVRNQNSPVALIVAGGYQWNEQYGIELGYGDFGTWTVNDPTPGSTQQFRKSTSVAYLAATGNMPLGADFSLFGKLGVAANRSKGEGTVMRPMLGFGSAYAITPKLSAKLEYDYFGRIPFGTQQKLSLGLQYKF